MTKKELEKRVVELEQEINFLKDAFKIQEIKINPIDVDRNMFKVPSEQFYPWGSPVIWC